MKKLNTLLISYPDLKSFNFKKRIKKGPGYDESIVSRSTQWESLGLEDTFPLLFINQQAPKYLVQLRSLTIEDSITIEKKYALTIRAPKLSHFYMTVEKSTICPHFQQIKTGSY
jgi:hypothetical protein